MYTVRDLKEILENKTIKEQWALPGKFLMAISLALILKSEVYVYGGGNDVHILLRLLKSYGLHVIKIIDKDSEKQGRYIDDVEIIGVDTFKNIETGNKFVFMFTSYFSGFSQFEFINTLREAKIGYYYAISNIDRKAITGHTHDWIDSNRMDYYTKNGEKIINFFQLLEDNRSRDTLYNYVKSYMTNSCYHGESIPTRYKYFADDGNVKLYKNLEDEVWINCGAAMGDTIFAFFAEKNKVKKILAFEEERVLCNFLQDNLNILPMELKDKVEIFNECIGAKLDYRKYLDGNKCTLINADIEGNEMEMLKSMSKIIIEDRPVLAICLYHKKEDIVEIPEYIANIVDDYKYYLRKYTASIVSIKRNHEIVLYAIPKERCIVK